MANTTKKLSTVDETASSDISSANMLCVSNGHVKQLPGYIQQIDKNKSDIADMMLKIYPVGAIYISASGTNPGTLFGGTWEQIKGRFLVGVGSVEANTTSYWGNVSAGSVNCPAGEKGGEAWHTLTVNEMPSHRHSIRVYASEDGLGGKALRDAEQGKPLAARQNALSHLSSEKNIEQHINLTGGGAAHNNMPPYLTVYMWKRTA